MKIKWLCVLGVISGLLIKVLPAYATDMNIFSQCALIPLAEFTGNGETTVVGLSNRFTGNVHWLFYDQDGLRLDQGSFQATEGVLSGFVMSAEVRSDLAGTLGFLLFCIDSNIDNRIDNNDTPGLTANAFQVDMAALDVAYLPVIPVFSGNLDEDSQSRDITLWSEDPIDDLAAGANGDNGDQITLQYLTDGVAGSGDESAVYIFTTNAPPASVMMTVIIAGQDPSVDVALQKARLNRIDIETVPGMSSPDVSGSGLMVWDVTGVTGAFAFTIVKSPAFGAAQTLLGVLGFSDEGAFGIGDDDDDEDEDDDDG